MTIMFASDWQRYPQAIIDLKTKNASFIRMASVLRSMGVKNHAFLLALHDKTLQGVDPFDYTKLTLEQQLRIALECKNNYWYFFREIVRVPAVGDDITTSFECNRGNIALIWLFFNHIMQILIQPRQTGKSFGTDCIMVLLLNIVCANTKINLLTKDDTLRRANIQRLKDISAELPIYLQQKGPTDLNNTEEITVNSLGNRYTTHVPQMSPKKAIGLGRGLTTSIFHIDESPFQTNIAIALPAALAAMGAAIDKSAAAGAPYGTILTTTAGKKDDKDGRFIYNMMMESATWTEKFLDAKDLKDLESMICRNSRGGVPRVSSVFNHRQLGKTDAWLRRKLQDSVSTGEDADRDFFNRWTSGSQTSPLAVHILEAIRESSRDPSYVEISPVGGYITNWYINADEIDVVMNNGHFIMSLDTSEASGGDDISLILLDSMTLDLIACGTFNETNLITFSQWIASWFVRFVNFTAIIERRSTGSTLIDYLLIRLPEMGIDPFKRLFNMIVHEKDEQPEHYAEICQPMNRRDPSIYVRAKKSFGFATSGSGVTSRTTLYSTILRIATSKAASKIYDRTLIEQITGLITKNGRVDHEDGAHDDMVIGWLLGCWLLISGKNLSHYGIDSRLVMTYVNRPEEIDPIVESNKQKQDQLRQRLEDLSKRLSSSNDDYVSMKIENEMKSLVSQLVIDEGEIISVDEMIRVARGRRKENKFNRYSQQSHQHSRWAGYHNAPMSHGYYIRGS